MRVKVRRLPVGKHPKPINSPRTAFHGDRFIASGGVRLPASRRFGTSQRAGVGTGACSVASPESANAGQRAKIRLNRHSRPQVRYEEKRWSTSESGEQQSRRYGGRVDDIFLRSRHSTRAPFRVRNCLLCCLRLHDHAYGLGESWCSARPIWAQCVASCQRHNNARVDSRR